MSSREPSIRKAAVLVASLDADTADLLLEQMPPEQADAVRQEVLELDEIDPTEQQAVIDEFFRIGPLVPESDVPGVELDDPVFEVPSAAIDEYVPTAESAFQLPLEVNLNQDFRIGQPAEFVARVPQPEAEIERQPFQFLQELDPETIVPLLEREHPQTIALVLSHVAPELAGNVLARLPAATQTDVVRRLVELEETDPHVLRDVERVVEASLLKQQPQRRRTAGMAAVSAILNASDRTARRQILNNLATHDRPLAHKLTPPAPPPRQFTFVEICELPLEALVRIVRTADRQTVVMALAGAQTELVDDLLDHLDAHEAERISNRLSNLGPVRLIDIDRAQEDLAHIAGHLHTEGRLPELTQSHLTAVV